MWYFSDIHMDAIDTMKLIHAQRLTFININKHIDKNTAFSSSQTSRIFRSIISNKGGMRRWRSPRTIVSSASFHFWSLTA